jgi:hypothetical protein
MIFTLALLQIGAAQAAAGQSYEGTGRPAVAIPRLAAEVTVDGLLAEPVWAQAARLTGFRQYQPADGRPAEERTEARVFYSRDAIYFGVVAHAKNPGSVRATIADRDNLGNDDRITIYLDTFNDKRRAFFFVVNPLGAQGDGMRTEGAASAGNMFGGNVDWNPDFRFDSKGQVTDSGYVIEVRIPFKSLRFPTGEPQTWGINVVRNVQATGFEDTWTDARRATASFLSEAGTLTGIADIERGITTEVQPFVTARWDGARTVGGDFEREDINPDAGVNLKLALPAVTLDATVKPDFSQVESDAGLVTVNERFALFFAEKRPFFLEGIELFNTPNQLVYTRQIASPVAGAKVTGKLGSVSVAYLSALDDTRCPRIVGDVRDVEQDCDKALFNIARLRQDFGGNSTVALTVTDRRAGSDTTNTVVAGDVRYVFGRMYYFESQLGGSWTKDPRLFGDGDMKVAPVWKAELDRTGRSWGFNYQFNGMSDEFVSRSGFVPRNGTIQTRAFNRLSYYGNAGARVENITMFFGPSRIWLYDDFKLGDAYEGGESLNFMFRLRGGWGGSASVGRDFFTLDPRAYTGLFIVGPDQLQPYVIQDDEISGLIQSSVTVNTPTFRRFNASVTLARDETPIFAEGSEGTDLRATASLTLRPTVSMRAEGSLQYSKIDREYDGSEFARTVIPRLKVEYQPTRALFFRVVSQYQSQRTSQLLTPWGQEIFRQNGAPVGGGELGALQTDWLVSYEPTPGTVAFLGYGDTRRGIQTSKLSDLERAADGFFVKVAYQWRR